MSLRIYKCSPGEELIDSCAYVIKRDWNNADLGYKISFALGLRDKELLFHSQIQTCPWFFEDYEPNTFHKELWHRNVAEVFIKSADSTQYQEFNFAPNGAWWSQLFSDYRKEDPTRFKLPQGLKVETITSGTSWSVKAEIPTTQLSIPFNADCEFNVCFITGRDPLRYSSSSPIAGKKPDFHDFKGFLPIEWSGVIRSGS
jgi:hypothetical protein